MRPSGGWGIDGIKKENTTAYRFYPVCSLGHDWCSGDSDSCTVALFRRDRDRMDPSGNYAEGMLTGRARQIQSAERVTEDLIPETCRYGVYDREGTYLYGTFEKEEREDAWEIIEKEREEKRGIIFEVLTGKEKYAL